MEVPAEYNPDAVIIDSCVASPGPLEELRPANAGDPFWMLIDSGCINDHTVQVLPRGDNGEVRFTFEGFAFHTFEEDPVSLDDFSVLDVPEIRVQVRNNILNILNLIDSPKST